MNFSDKIVKKPWGLEFPIYQTPECEIWLLQIKNGCETSFHSHPNKKTALAVLGGCVKVSLFSSSFPLLPSEKMNIRHGVFHKTEAWSAGGATLLEMETPPDKTNLVRMRDKYGRVGQGYETTYIEREYFGENLILGKCKPIYGSECNLIMWDVKTIEELNNFDESNSIFILSGSIMCDNFPVVGVGDATDPKTLRKLIDEFGFKPLRLLGIKRDTEC